MQSVPAAATSAASALAAASSSSLSSFSLPLSPPPSSPPSESLTTLVTSLSTLLHALSDLSQSLSSQPLFLPLASASAALSVLLLVLALSPSEDDLPSSPYARTSTSYSSPSYGDSGADSSSSGSAMMGGTNGSSASSMMVVPVDTTGSLSSNRRAAAGGRKGPRKSYDGRELPLSYDPDAINAYFLRRPGVLLRRAVWAAGQTGGVVWQLVQDALQGGVSAEEERERAKQVVALIARLGPTAIKVRAGRGMGWLAGWRC